MDSGQKNGSETARMIWIVGSPIIFTVGVFGNIMTIIVLTSKRNKSTSSTIFLTFLAFADLLVMTIMLPRWWLIYLFDFDVRYMHNIICKFQFFATYFSGPYSSALLAAVTIERAICTVKPYTVKTICTVQVATIISIILAVILFLIHGHILIGINLSDVNYNVTSEENDLSLFRQRNKLLNATLERSLLLEENCNIASNLSKGDVTNDSCSILEPNNEGADIRQIKVCWYDDSRYGNYFLEIHQIVAAVCYLVIPETVFFVGDFIIVRSLQRSHNLRMRMRTEQMRSLGYKPAFDNRANQITLTLLLVNITFVFTTSPACIFLMGMSSWVDNDTGMTATQEIVWAIVNMSIYINHSINFILYFLSGHRFRRQVLETFECRKTGSGFHDTRVSLNQNGSMSVSNCYDINLK